jgi:hypothetical protein
MNQQIVKDFKNCITFDCIMDTIIVGTHMEYVQIIEPDTAIINYKTPIEYGLHRNKTNLIKLVLVRIPKDANL